MKFKQYLSLITDLNGFIPTTRLRWTVRKNDRPTAREEAIAAKIIEDANPRENITGRFPWGTEEQFVLQQLWIQPGQVGVWRDVTTAGGESLYSTEKTAFGDLPVPNAIKEPGQVKADFHQRIKEMLGEDNG